MNFYQKKQQPTAILKLFQRICRLLMKAIYSQPLKKKGIYRKLEI